MSEELNVRRAVAIWDSDMDQQITADEFVIALKSLGLGLTSAEEDDILKEIGDKKISWEDAVVRINKKEKGLGNSWLYDNLKKFDHHGNGSIATSELQAALENIGTLLSAEQKKEVLELLNDNGRVSMDKICKGLKNAELI